MAAILSYMRDERMALFIAKVRNVYDGSGVGGNQLQGVAGIEAFQALARLQHGKRAEQAGGVEFMFHRATIAVM